MVKTVGWKLFTKSTATAPSSFANAIQCVFTLHSFLKLVSCLVLSLSRSLLQWQCAPTFPFPPPKYLRGTITPVPLSLSLPLSILSLFLFGVCTNCPLFIWSGAIVFFVSFMYLGQGSVPLWYHCPVHCMWLTYCVFVLSGQIQIDRYRAVQSQFNGLHTYRHFVEMLFPETGNIEALRC